MEAEIHNLEKLAYGAVLRAFKAQSNALTWDKEGLITELRKELRVSDDEHRELLTGVNSDDLIRRIREWREAGGGHDLAPGVPQHVTNQLPSPSVSASRKRQKAPFSMQSQSLHSQPGVGVQQPSASSGKWGPTSTTGLRPIAGQPVFGRGKPSQYPSAMNGVPEGARDPLVGRRVMIRGSEDNNFYEALITDYNPSDGCHALVYDSNTPDATGEWVNFKEIHPEDVRWVGENPVMSRDAEASGLNSGRGRASSTNQLAADNRSANDVVVSDDYEQIEILNTDILIQKVHKLIEASPNDLLEITKAKKMLKDQEQSLMEVIKKLANVTAIQDKERLSQLNVDGGGGPTPELARPDKYGATGGVER